MIGQEEKVKVPDALLSGKCRIDRNPETDVYRVTWLKY